MGAAFLLASPVGPSSSCYWPTDVTMPILGCCSPPRPPLLPPVALVHSRSFHLLSLRYVTFDAVDSPASTVCGPPHVNQISCSPAHRVLGRLVPPPGERGITMRGHRRCPLPEIAVLRPTNADRLDFCNSVIGPMHLPKSTLSLFRRASRRATPPPRQGGGQWACQSRR